MHWCSAWDVCTAAGRGRGRDKRPDGTPPPPTPSRDKATTRRDAVFSGGGPVRRVTAGSGSAAAFPPACAGANAKRPTSQKCLTSDVTNVKSPTRGTLRSIKSDRTVNPRSNLRAHHSACTTTGSYQLFSNCPSIYPNHTLRAHFASPHIQQRRSDGHARRRPGLAGRTFNRGS